MSSQVDLLPNLLEKEASTGGYCRLYCHLPAGELVLDSMPTQNRMLRISKYSLQNLNLGNSHQNESCHPEELVPKSQGALFCKHMHRTTTLFKMGMTIVFNTGAVLSWDWIYAS